MDLSLVREIPRLERDIRALTAEEIKSALDALKVVKTLNDKNAKNKS